MAESFYKSLDSGKDVVSTRTLLHEAIPLTGTIVYGTYSEANIKNYAHGMFQSVYDYPYLSSSANHVFDITAGVGASSGLYGSVTNQKSKKLNIYNQMAQVLMGYDHTGSILRFDEDGDILGGGDKIDNALFYNFSRLLVKDEIKKGTFSLKFGVGGLYTDPYSSIVEITDASGSNAYLVNSPVGEYGILYAKNDTGTPLANNNSRCGLLFYQAGVAVVTGSVFKSASSTATWTFSDKPNETTTITLTDYEGTAVVFEIDDNADGVTGSNVAVTLIAENGGGATGTAIDLVAKINASALKITASVVSAGRVLLRQDGGGSVGDKSIALSDSSNWNAACSVNVPAAFTGGNSAGLLNGTVGETEMTSHNAESIQAILTGSNIEATADALRYRMVNLQFNNTVELNSTVYFCRVNHNEYNYSTNPTYLTGSKIRVKTQSSDLPVSYITTVGLYNDNNELLGVAKLSEPLKKTPDTELTLRVRLDY